LRAAARSVLAASCGTLALGAAAAERNLADLSIEELMNETITSVSKKEQRLGDVAAAISVLTNDDLRRSGATHIADALRQVPGVNVGSLNSNEWAVSSRGFNQVYANKLLVLVDGRAVYTPMFGGVYWDLQQMPLEHVDRIEIIRGPGATIWGTNAVNGVINIVTRDARDTQGALAYGEVGSYEQSLGGLRVGGELGQETFFRAFAEYQDNSEFLTANGSRANDGWQLYQGGFRIDHHAADGRQLTWQADFTSTERDDGLIKASNVNSVARWREKLSERSSFEVQTYYDRTYRNEAHRSRNSVDTLDIAAQHRVSLGARHELIWGAGYRYIDMHIEQTEPLTIVKDGHLLMDQFSAFIQDEYQLIPDKLLITAGTKVEHHEFTGFEWLPSLRVAYKPTSRQTVWAAVSRAVATPNVVQATDALETVFPLQFELPDGVVVMPAFLGNADLKPEVLHAYELGYRVQPTDHLSFDATLFYNDYEDGVTFGDVEGLRPGLPLIARIPWVNGLESRTRGAELSVTVSPTPSWRIVATYSYLIVDVSGIKVDAGVYESSSPEHQASLRSSYDFSERLSLNALLRYADDVGDVTGIMTAVDRHVNADANFTYRPSDTVELSLIGRNLLRARQLEQPHLPPGVSTEAPRSIYGKIAWRF
jgi:iron complex outermembrane receptor protein